MSVIADQMIEVQAAFAAYLGTGRPIDGERLSESVKALDHVLAAKMEESVTYHATHSLHPTISTDPCAVCKGTIDYANRNHETEEVKP